MQFDLSDDQEALRDAARALLEAQAPMARVRAVGGRGPHARRGAVVGDGEPGLAGGHAGRASRAGSSSAWSRPRCCSRRSARASRRRRCSARSSRLARWRAPRGPASSAARRGWAARQRRRRRLPGVGPVADNAEGRARRRPLVAVGHARAGDRRPRRRRRRRARRRRGVRRRPGRAGPSRPGAGDGPARARSGGCGSTARRRCGSAGPTRRARSSIEAAVAHAAELLGRHRPRSTSRSRTPRSGCSSAGRSARSRR